mgnify:CR=1 FL=1
MSEGTGSSLLDGFLDIGTQIISAGTAGFGEKGFDDGVSTKLVKDTRDGVKDLIGVTAAEEHNELLRKQIEDEKAAALKDRQDARSANDRDAIQASRTSGGSRSAGIKTSQRRSSRFSSLGSDDRDFLGL